MKTMPKVWLGIFTFLPIVLMVIFFGTFFTVLLERVIEADRGYYDHDFPIEHISSLAWFIILIIITALISLGVKIFYIVHSVNNPDNDTGKKVMWILILIFVGTIGSIVYYFVEILPSKPAEQLST
jgi:hypothetical protein